MFLAKIVPSLIAELPALIYKTLATISVVQKEQNLDRGGANDYVVSFENNIIYVLYCQTGGVLSSLLSAVRCTVKG